MAYLNSENIQMYPSAYRIGSIDKFAQLNTEFNLTHTKLLSQYDKNNNYSYENSGYLILYIHGYYFNILKTAITSIQHNTNNNLYAAIQLANYNDTKVLVNYEDVTQTTLDMLKSGSTTDYEFQGLYITDDSTGIGNYYIKIAEWQNNSWNIVTQPLKLSTDEIRDATNTLKDITEEFNTELLNVTNIDATNINTANIDTETFFNNSINATVTIGAGTEDEGLIKILPNKSGNSVQQIYLGDTNHKYADVYFDDSHIDLIHSNIISATTSISAPTITSTTIINASAITATGTISASSVSAQTVTATSDIRLKENIKNFKCEKSILDLPIKEFDFKDTGKHSIGCIAQELQEICPEIVHENEEGFLTIEENKLVYLLIQEVKKLKEEIKNLK